MPPPTLNSEEPVSRLAARPVSALYRRGRGGGYEPDWAPLWAPDWGVA